MRLFVLAFALGVWLAQQQAALADGLRQRVGIALAATVSLLPALASHERPRGFKVFLVKGLLSSVVKSLEQIKLQLAAPKPMEQDLPINMADFY